MSTSTFTIDLSATQSLLWREIIRFLRQRSRIVGALATPIIFWLFLGFGVGQSFNDGTLPAAINYIEYFFPGTLVMIILFTAIFSTISIIEDRREGFLQGVLVAPVSRGSIVLGKVLGGAILAAGQTFLLCLAAPFIGLTPEPLAILKLLLLIPLLSIMLTALGYLIAWPMDSTHGFHAIMNIFLIPLWLLSGALFSVQGAQGLIAWLMHINPLTYGLAAMRYTLYPVNSPWLGSLPNESLCYLITALTTVLLLAGCFWITLRERKV
ncbi:MAG: ABC transporter permease [Blastochloris sp.]|nr:ABC transporter permease [Blastochloris sp.]